MGKPLHCIPHLLACCKAAPDLTSMVWPPFEWARHCIAGCLYEGFSRWRAVHPLLDCLLQEDVAGLAGVHALLKQQKVLGSMCLSSPGILRPQPCSTVTSAHQSGS